MAFIYKEVSMQSPHVIPLTQSAIFTMAEIKTATRAFDRGDTNVFNALDAIAVAIEAYHNATEPRRDAA